MANCLTPVEIADLLADTLLAEDKAGAEAHLRACERCREQVEARRAENQLFGEIKRAYREGNASERSDPDATQTGAPGAASRPAIADTIEGYEILAEVHRGGQGVVYKAVQKATKRTVALKVLLQGPYASPRQRHRFEREIDLVASLQHPNIVTVYDSGVTEDDRHFFAMEYIRGQSLSAYLSDKNLSIDETLRLFQKICAAVNYAHQRGVIHRDLKPGNIRIDANGEPHVLDFGLAKAAGSDLSGGVPVTVTGDFLGTLAYASPEQTKGDPNLIDIRTDVYSLGVILYEMLTGKYPYPVVGQMADVLKNIAEAEPKKPSTIRVAAGPRTGRINDEIDTIVLKALSKERERRYQSAENLARDVEHYLSGEAIEAKRDSAWYVLKKGFSRHRTTIVMTVVLTTVLAGLTRVTWESHRRQLLARERLIVARHRADVRGLLQHLAGTEYTSELDVHGRQVLEEVCERLRGGTATDLDRRAFVEAFLHVEYGCSDFVLSGSPEVALGMGLRSDIVEGAAGLGMLVEPVMFLDGSRIGHTSPESVLLWIDGGESEGGNPWRVQRLGSSLSLGTHKLSGHTAVRVVRWAGSVRESPRAEGESSEYYRELPGIPVDRAIPPRVFSVVESYPRNYPPRIVDRREAARLDDSLLIEQVALRRTGAANRVDGEAGQRGFAATPAGEVRLQVRLSFARPKYTLLFEVRCSAAASGWSKSVFLGCASGSPIAAEPIGGLSRLSCGGVDSRCEVELDIGVDDKQFEEGETRLNISLVASEYVARQLTFGMRDIIAAGYLDFRIERSAMITLDDR